MTVHIVTDSTADLPVQLAEELGITVVPAYVRFGNTLYRDGVDLSTEEFYDKLVSSSVLPFTSAPSPGEFAQTYEELTHGADEIVSIHVTRRHSSTYDSALLGMKMAKKAGCQIDVIDSEGVSMWLGLVVLAAARAAKAGYQLHQVVDTAQKAIQQMRALALLDTVKYIVKGGRLGNAFSNIEAILNLKALLTLRNGVLRPAGLVRNRRKGIERLGEFIRSAPHIEELAIVYSTTPEDAEKLADYVAPMLINVVPLIVRLGPALGVHAGPGALIVVNR
jgi:DegV family protein with EDD domain